MQHTLIAYKNNQIVSMDKGNFIDKFILMQCALKVLNGVDKVVIHDIEDKEITTLTRSL